MAEILGSLIDKLTIVKLKQWHSEDINKLENLKLQQEQLQDEINNFIGDSFSGKIPTEKLVFKSNKVYKKDKFIENNNINFSLSKKISDLAEINCKLWHEQEKVYDFENVPNNEKNNVIHNIAVLNLERNSCIDNIDSDFQIKVTNFLQDK